MTRAIKTAEGVPIYAGNWVRFSDRAAWERVQSHGAEILFVAGQVERIVDSGDGPWVEFSDFGDDVWRARPAELSLVTGGLAAAEVFYRARLYLKASRR